MALLCKPGDRWRTLLSVDDLVGAVVATLEREKLLEQTYIFYSSECVAI